MSTPGPYAAPELETPFAEWEAAPAWEGEPAFEDLAGPARLTRQAAAVIAGPAARPTGSCFVRVTGSRQGAFRGDVQGHGHDGWLLGRGFEQVVTAPRDAATGQAAGRRIHHPIVLRFGWGAASPQFLQALTTNEVLQVQVEFAGTTADGVEQVTQRLTLGNAALATVRRTAGDGVPPTDEVTLVAQRVELSDLVSGTTAADAVIAQAELETPPAFEAEAYASEEEEAPAPGGWATETYAPDGARLRPCDDQPRLA